MKDVAGNARAASGSLSTFNFNGFAYADRQQPASSIRRHDDCRVTISQNNDSLLVTRGSTTLTFDGVTSINAIGTSAADNLEIAANLTQPISFTGGTGNESVHVISGNSYTFTSDLSPTLHNVSVTIDSGATATFASTETSCQSRR